VAIDGLESGQRGDNTQQITVTIMPRGANTDVMKLEDRSMYLRTGADYKVHNFFSHSTRIRL
jgi:hypothetical protein